MLNKKSNPVFISIFICVINAVIAWFFILKASDHTINSYVKLQTLYVNNNYNLLKIREKKEKIPRIYINKLPKDFNMIENISEKKDLFIKILLPLILKKNEEILNYRNFLFVIKEKINKKQNLSPKEQKFLENIRNFYKSEKIDNLLVKIDEIPASIAIAQAILETGWGESRFVLNGNSLFGEWTWKNTGMKPRKRDKGKTHKIKTFETLYSSVDSYVNNLNSSRYYYLFRQKRANLRKQKKELKGDILTDYLDKYSTNPNYKKQIKKIIYSNNLNDFNDVKLKE